MTQRLLGVFLLVIGTAMSYWCIYEPLDAAARHEPKLSVHMKGAILCPVAVVMGAAYLILGKKAIDIFGTREHPTPTAWVAAVVLVLAGVGLYFWLKSSLEAQGYQF